MDIAGGLFYLFAAVCMLYVVHFGMYLMGANCYDMWQYQRLHRRGRRMLHASLKRAARARDYFVGGWDHSAEVPGLLTIAVPAHNEEKVIARCLDSIRRSTYRKIEVLVADDASTDSTNQIVRDYMARYPKMNLRIFKMPTNMGKGSALNMVLSRYAHGQFVMTIDADSLITPNAIRNALSYFEDPYVAGVAANVQIIDDPSVLGVLQKLEHMVGYRSKKMYSFSKCEFVVGGVASTYRMGVLREVGFYDTDTVTEDIGLSIKITSLGNKKYRVVYGSDVVAMTEGVTTFSALFRQRFRWKYGSMQNVIKYSWLMFNPRSRYTLGLTMYRMPMAMLSEFTLLISPLAWTYAMQMTLTQYNPQLIIGAYLTITAYILLTIWYDENLSWRTRLRLSFYAPLAYFIFYIMDLIQLVAILRCLRKTGPLLRQKNVGTTWVSPRRVGKQVVAAHGS